MYLNRGNFIIILGSSFIPPVKPKNNANNTSAQDKDFAVKQTATLRKIYGIHSSLS